MSKTGNDFTKLPPRSPNKYSSKIAASAQRSQPQQLYDERRGTEQQNNESESEYYDEEDESPPTNLENIQKI